MVIRKGEETLWMMAFGAALKSGRDQFDSVNVANYAIGELHSRQVVDTALDPAQSDVLLDLGYTPSTERRHTWEKVVPSTQGRVAVAFDSVLKQWWPQGGGYGDIVSLGDKRLKDFLAECESKVGAK